MKYCKHCGAAMSDDASFCSSCGRAVENSAELVEKEIVSFQRGNINERSIAVAIVLSIITCGLYSIYWMIKINNEALALSRENGPSGGLVILLNIITCGIYGYFWAYKMGVCTDKIKGTSNGNTGILYVVLAFLGLNIVNMALTQDAINGCVGK
jgi:hypothetical protein